ncbi:NtaA/DmoA family FMN-dependent monooxygenase [Pseudonocardia endophytica]|uniref:FMN-dependent oxidoreductase (Nitrilotriacetate monooxygenase family) n=1 Tax=Pseudonocardia endophytica TaxID=401976 RepID=A0A4R1HM22_PSEEN|nr:NtaA/DmoA family FMN-dependent monooxygenase [Pseudonocardia endophytica]TCK22161.1 FMN-dependent oxidoreductase (nitrilotriacetate monooxygenase family) [Pseudonocardia endophytica]
MIATPRRTLKTVTGAGGTSETYDLAVDPNRSTLDQAVRVAGLAEAARIDALFTADLLSFDAQGAIGSQEPLVFVSALSQVTSRIGLIATVSTTFHHPYNLARLFGTLDHVSNGRAAWNLVTSSIGEENFGPGALPSPEDRYARAAETLDVVNALWDSWRPGALTAGPDGRAVLDRDRVHPIDHSGRFFSVAGPLNIPPLPQGRPVQIQAGQSEAGTALGARYAEIVFTSLPTLDIAREFTRNIRNQAERHGRPGGLPLIFSSFHATYGATEQEAQRIVAERREALDFDRGRVQVADMLGGGLDLSELPLDAPLPESLLPDVASVNRRRGRVGIFSGYVRQGYTLRELVVAAQDTGHWAVAGTPEQLADAVEERFRAGVLDVISLQGLANPVQHDFVVNGLLHELRKRGIVADDYTGTTLRDNLGLDLPPRSGRTA